MCKTNNKRDKLRSLLMQGAARFTALLLTAAMLLAGGAMLLPMRAEAAIGDLDDGLDNTYALQVSTGTVSTAGSLADEILYFKINYVDEDGYVRSHRIFPGENALGNSSDWAIQQESLNKSAGLGTTEESERRSHRETILSKLGVTVTGEAQAFQAYATDTFFFQPLKKVKSIESIEILMCDSESETRTASGGTWSCQAMRVYQVSAVHGMGMYGYVSNRRFADFEGTLIAKMEQAKTFNWVSDRMFRITSDGSGDGRLTQVNESYSTQSQGRLVRIDIADTYGAGIRAMGNNTKKTLLTPDFEECAALVLRYQDVYGAVREAYLPLMTSVVGFALENGISEYEMLSGLAQEGDTLAVAATLPDAASVDSVRLIYGTEAAKAVTGVQLNPAKTPDGYGSDASTDLQDRTVWPADTDGEDADLLSIVGLSIYDPAVSNVGETVYGTKLLVAFSGSPESYYRAPSAAGTTIRPVKAGNSGVELSLQKYENGARLLPTDTAERYLVILSTDDAELAGTAGELYMTLNYTDLNGKEQSSDTINVSDAVTAYYGEWPGVRSGFMYRMGTKSGGTLCFTVPLKDVDRFTGAQFLLRGNDNWQMKGMEIYQLTSLEPLTAEWISVSDGTQTSDRMYSRAYTGNKLLSLTERILVDGGMDPTSTKFNSDNTTTVDTDTGDWSEYRYSLSYEMAQNLGRFAKSRCSYTVAVEVGSDQISNASDGDCGSKNQFFFQLVFEDGKSSYVLANQQLASDGFRTGYTEQFVISTNRDMGELTAVKIVPEDSADSSDVFDKLKINSICVKKQTTEAVSRQWIISNVGWIDINYQDEAAGSSSSDYTGRSEAEVVKTYQVEASTYAVNLEFAITTGSYNISTVTGATEPQFAGQVYATIEYYNSNGALKSESYNVVEAMYAYSGQEKKSGSAETVGQNIWPGGTESDVSFMFRPGKTDRFTLSVEDISQLLRITLEVRSKVQTTWNIENIYVSLAGSGGRRIINTENEYQWVYSKEMEQLCSSTNSGVKAYSMTLPVNQLQTINVDFTENKIEWAESAKNLITSVTSRQPRSADDSLNIYVYTTEAANSNVLKGVTMEAGVQYSRIYGGFNRIETKMTLGESNGSSIFYATGVPVSGINTLNKLDLLAYFNDPNETGQVNLAYAVVQQVRSSVVIGTFYVDFSGCDAAADSRGVSRTPVAEPTGTAQFKQVVTLAFADSMNPLRLTPETDDIAVALLYTTTNDASGREYESPLIYLTDQNWSDLRAGKVVDLTFNEAYLDKITGIRIRGTGPSTRSGVSVAAAMAVAYETNAASGEDYVTGSFSFANGVRLTAGQSNQIMKRTDAEEADKVSVSQLTVQFTVPEVSEIPAASENANGQVTMLLNYRTSNGTEKTLTVYDICQYAVESNASFQPGNTITMRMLLTNVEKIRWLSLIPTSEAGDAASLTLNELNAVFLQSDGSTLSYRCSLRDWSGSGVISLFGSVRVKLSAVTTNPSSNVQEYIEVESGGTKRQLIESGQTVIITPTVTDSSEGYTYRVERFKDSFTSNAPEVLTSKGGTLCFQAVNEYTVGSGTEVYYRVTVSSREVPSVQTIIEFVVEPKYVSDSQTVTPAETTKPTEQTEAAEPASEAERIEPTESAEATTEAATQGAAAGL